MTLVLGSGERAWTCARCGARAIATARPPRGWPWTPIEEFGAVSFERDAERDVAAVMELIRCPTCKQRSPAARRASLRRVSVDVVGLTVANGLVLSPVLLVVPGWWRWILPIGGALLLLFTLWTELQRWRHADRARLLQLRAGASALPVAIAQPGVTATRPRLAPIDAAPPPPTEPTDARTSPRFLGDRTATDDDDH